MFDRYTLPRSDVHVHNNIEQKPHDPADAARLYGELKDKAEREVAEATVVRLGVNNELTAVQVHTQHRFDTGEVAGRLLFKLNGHLHDIEVKINAEDLALRIYREVAIELVTQIMKSLHQGNRLHPQHSEGQK